MNTPTTTIEVPLWSYDDAPDDLKQKILDKHYGINVENGYWYLGDSLLEIANDYGLEIQLNEMCFDLDRGSYVYFETYNHGGKPDYKKGIVLKDHDKFVEKSGLKPIKGDYDFWIEHIHFGGGGGKNTIEHNDCAFPLADDQIEALQTCLNEFCDEILKALREMYDDSTSEEAIVDTLNANEYLFDTNGDIQA